MPESIGAAAMALVVRRLDAEALARVAADEAEHAALAWDVLRWAVGRGGAPVRDAVAAAAAELRPQSSPVCTPRGEGWTASRDELAWSVDQAWRRVIRPELEALGVPLGRGAVA